MEKSLIILASIEVNHFYCCTIWKNEINLQGHATKENLEYCKSIGVDNFTFKNDILTAKKDNINITLTY